MKTDIFIEPESGEEIELIELIAAARDYGVEETELTADELAVVFNQFAIGLMKQDEEFVEDMYECPECGQPIDEVKVLALGVDPVVQPCGCTVDYENLPEELYMNDQ